MGQQQLLLVILVTIIVGIATVVAINVFGTSAASANEDAVRQDVLTIAASAQGWYIKPIMMDGGGNSFENMTFFDISFPAEKINAAGTIAENMNGTYVLGTGTTSGIPITAYMSSADGYVSTIGDTTAVPSAQTSASLSGTIEPDYMDWD
jgi:hypothetical protein